MSRLLKSPPSFFFNDTATTEIYTLSLHDALPISVSLGHGKFSEQKLLRIEHGSGVVLVIVALIHGVTIVWQMRSEEHTSKLQSHLNLVCRLLLEKKKKIMTKP